MKQLSWHQHNLKRFNHSPQKRQRVNQKLHYLWQRAIATLKTSSEPQVWQTSEALWSAYDPVTGRSIDQLSTAEMRSWLEERHYQNHLATDRMQQLKWQHYQLR